MRVRGYHLPSNRFNPHPLQRAGATVRSRRPVSNPLGFNPHPLQRAGATPSGERPAPRRKSFNPHPLQRAGATPRKAGERVVDQVSILTRSKERVLRHHSDSFAAMIEFQSSPAPKSGCYPTATVWTRRTQSFNPHPLQRAGATRSSSGMPYSSSRFQSSPAPKSGCYAPKMLLARQDRRFNPHPLQRAGATRLSALCGSIQMVSILTRSKERVLRSYFTKSKIAAREE